MTSEHSATRALLRRSSAASRLSALAVGETLEIADSEADDYRHARDQVPERVFVGTRGRDANRAWYVLERKS